MADVKTRILLRNDTLANWSSVNPVIGKGEFAVVYDPTVTGTRKIRAKIGDGSANFNDLPFLADYDSRLETIETAIEGKISKTSETYNLPYYFEVVYGADKVTVKDYTVDLNNGNKGIYSLDIAAATESTAGIVTAADKQEINKVAAKADKTYVDTQDAALQANIDSEASARATADSTLETAINTEKTRAEGAEATLQTNINNEATARTNADTTLQSNINAEIARATAAEATKTTQELTNANGKALILNEADGGGIFFEKTDGTSKSFIGVNDSTAGGPDAQIYAINPADNNKGSKIDITKEAIYYSANTTLPYSQRTIEANEIATKGVVDNKVASEASRATTAENALSGRITTIEGDYLKAADKTELEGKITAEESARIFADTGLETRIAALEARGRFLSAWNAVTGKPATEPTTIPYKLQAGDYFIVETVAGTGETNKQPEAKLSEGSYYYDGTASTTAETRELGIGDYYTFDGTKYILVQNSQKTVTFANIAGNARDNANLKGEIETLEAADTTLQTNINTEAATRATEDAKKVDKTVTGTNGTAYIFNESDGGGAKFVHNDGLESFVGVNDGGSDGLAAQIYADKYVDGKWSGAKLDVTNGGIYYTVGDKSRAERDVEANLLAVKGDVTAEATARATAIATEKSRAETAEAALQASKQDVFDVIDGGSASDWA